MDSRVEKWQIIPPSESTNERRAHFGNKEIKEILESHGFAFKLRQKRNSHLLLNIYDDLFLRYQRS